MEDINTEINRLKEQQKELVFDEFNEDIAWNIGNILREKAIKNHYVIAISITLNRRKLFYCSVNGATPINDKWVERKENTVYKFFKSSYEMSLYMKLKEDKIAPRYGLECSDYAASGGCVPVIVRGTGVVGTIAVSGLKENEDHDLVASTIHDYINK